MMVPVHKGFGSTVIERAIRFTLGGTSRVAFEPASVRVRIELPARYLGMLLQTSPIATCTDHVPSSDPRALDGPILS
ncbi:MAG: hypothetical protein R3E87_14495 [Burkholderiaceae bacterium]